MCLPFSQYTLVSGNHLSPKSLNTNCIYTNTDASMHSQQSTIKEVYMTTASSRQLEKGILQVEVHNFCTYVQFMM